ncbi:MAG TPA: DNA starvation/stationary phase protection protein Dps [Thermoanaerobaculia bacterium]|jgi:starvation-inducible DNA-binding protein
MHPTKNDLPQKTRVKVIAVLADRLADATDLMLQSKQAHWNVKGPNFIALHELFDKVAESSEEWVDSLAERIVQLGGTAEGTVQATAARTSLSPYPLQIVGGTDHVEALSSALAAFGKRVRAAIDKTDKQGDKGTADLFTEISRDVDKYLWFVEAHNQRLE